MQVRPRNALETGESKLETGQNGHFQSLGCSHTPEKQSCVIRTPKSVADSDAHLRQALPDAVDVNIGQRRAGRLAQCTQDLPVIAAVARHRHRFLQGFRALLSRSGQA